MQSHCFILMFRRMDFQDCVIIYLTFTTTCFKSDHLGLLFICSSNIPSMGTSMNIDYDEKIALKWKYNMVLPI